MSSQDSVTRRQLLARATTKITGKSPVDRRVNTGSGNEPTERGALVDWLGELLWHWQNGNCGFSDEVLAEAIVAI